MQPQTLKSIFDDSRVPAGHNAANLLFPTTIVGFSPTNKLWTFAIFIVRTHFCFFLLPFLSLTVMTSFLLIKVLYGLFVTCTKSQVNYFLICVHYSKRFCQGTHNTFFLRRALWQSFCDTFHSFS